jgi:prepilin-type N-terminal cleavage/methylation domain-containing protein/prepilin-type processing-associated H-X9-DG protein
MRIQRRGFTLIELLVVIAIIAILAAILFPVFAQAREQARSTACLSNLKQLGVAISMYRSDWDSRGPFSGWPPSFSGQFNIHSPNSVYEQDWQCSIQPYIKNALVLHCPSDKTPYDERPVSYLYNPYMAINREPAPEATFQNAAEICLVWEGYGPKESATQKVPDNAPLPKNFYRQYAPWGTRAQDLAEPSRGLVRHRNGGNVVFFDTHAKFVAYGTGSNNPERTASINTAFPCERTVAPQIGKCSWTW